MKLITGDCVEEMKKLDPDSIDSIVTDPPYGLEFMGKDWDKLGTKQAQDWHYKWAVEAFRVAKPGAHIVAFGGTRTFHRLTCALEDAGWEIRDCLMWLYGTGFPKSMNVSKAIDKMGGRIGQSTLKLKQELRKRVKFSGKTGTQIDKECGFRAMNYLTIPVEGNRPDPWVDVLPSQQKWDIMCRVLGCDDKLDLMFVEAEREVVGKKKVIPGVAFSTTGPTELDITAPATDEAKQWDGWGTALKPAWEPIILARKPLIGTVAKNILEYGTGGMNVDECRIETNSTDAKAMERANTPNSGRMKAGGSPIGTFVRSNASGAMDTTKGRWPANVVLDEEAGELLDEQSGKIGSASGVRKKAKSGQQPFKTDRGWNQHSMTRDGATAPEDYGDSGGASRFFYCAKASRSERGEGNTHPTVKTVALMRWLCKLITPPKGIILDPFLGSGTTGIAAAFENFEFVGIDKEEEYVKLAQSRIDAHVNPNAGKFFE